MSENLKLDVSPPAPVDLLDAVVEENAERKPLIYEIVCFECGHRTLVSPAVFGILKGRCPNWLTH